jgi:lysophospholipase L1-like esterase
MTESEQPKPSQNPLILRGLDLLIFLTAAGCFISWMLTPVEWKYGIMKLLPNWKSFLIGIPILLIIGRGVYAVSTRNPEAPAAKRRFEGVFLKLGMAVLACFIPLAAWEQVLEHQEFEYQPKTMIIVGQDGKADPNSKKVTRTDPELLIRFIPGVMFNGRRINAMGHPEREVEEKKARGTLRIICMGDSVTGQGPPTYASVLHNKLQESPIQGTSWESFGMGVHGYSSSQGLRLFQMKTKNLAPDIVTVYFGWNDHWLAKPGRHDSARMVDPGNVVRVKNNTSVQLRELLLHKRFGQYIEKLVDPPQDQERAAIEAAAAKAAADAVEIPENGDKPLYYRVSEEEFRENLTKFVAEIRAVGAVPILLTAPRATTLSAHLASRQKQCITVAQATKAHDDYASIVREVAQEQNAALLDLHTIMAAEELQPLFQKDGIHFGLEGLAYVGGQIYEAVEAVVESEEWKTR